MDVRLRELAGEQYDLVAAWQLLRLGWTRHGIAHRVSKHGWRSIHPGVYALTAAPLTRHQRWLAATITTPDSFLSNASAAACWGTRKWEGGFEIVTRPGTGGPRRRGGLLVLRSRTLEGDTTTRDGIRITTGARTAIDMAAHLSHKQVGRMFREALRLKITSTELLLEALERHQGRRGTRHLNELATRYRGIPYHRTRSDAEGLALEQLHDARRDPPRVNVRIAGEEADLVWPDRRLIVEIDGPQFHRFPDEDARKQSVWERAGYTVRRIGSDAVYDDPARLLALATVT